jgi:rod shape-determining protein MreC
MLRRRHYIAVGIVVALTLIILNLPGRASARLRLGIGSLFLPFFGLSSGSQQLANAAADALTPRGELLRQLEELRKQNQDLQLQAKQAEDALRENQRLRSLLAWEQQKPWKLKLARVVLHDPSNLWRTLQIDVGSRDGIRTNMAVLSPDGALVGRVSAVMLTRSQVVLLGDPNCKVASRVENDTRDMGVLGAAGPLDSEFLEMGYLRNANLKPGQKVVTSGEGGIFPANIYIGQVVDVRPVEYGLAEAARVKLAANLNSLEELWVRTE